MILRCVVIDKDPTALDLTSRYIDNFPVLKLLQTFTDVLTGGEFLRNNPADLLFIELGVDDKSAISLVNSIKEKILIVFTVGCNVVSKNILAMDVLDYLVKPFSYERFSKLVDKAIHTFDTKVMDGQTIYIRSDYQLVRVFLDEIEYIESVENYIRVHLITGRSVMSLIPLSSFIEKLPKDKFIRIHRKYVIALDKIEYVTKRKIKVSTAELPVGDSHSEVLKTILNRK